MLKMLSVVLLLSLVIAKKKHLREKKGKYLPVETTESWYYSYLSNDGFSAILTPQTQNLSKSFTSLYLSS